MTQVAVFSLVTYRLTRMVILDTLFDTPRIWFHGWLLGRTGRLRAKVYELVTCPFCISVWIAGVVVAAATIWRPVPDPVWVWLASAAGSLMVWRFVELKV